MKKSRIPHRPSDSPDLWYAPPDFVIPLVWLLLFTLMGIARYCLILAGQQELQWWLLGLAFLCASYAYYTLGLARLTGISPLWFGLIGNIIVILSAALVMYKLLPASRTAVFLILPVIVWTAFAGLIVIGELKLKRLV